MRSTKLRILYEYTKTVVILTEPRPSRRAGGADLPAGRQGNLSILSFRPDSAID